MPSWTRVKIRARARAPNRLDRHGFCSFREKSDAAPDVWVHQGHRRYPAANSGGSANQHIVGIALIDLDGLSISEIRNGQTNLRGAVPHSSALTADIRFFERHSFCADGIHGSPRPEPGQQLPRPQTRAALDSAPEKERGRTQARRIRRQHAGGGVEPVCH